jgi:rhodanese-related sulfurtransferase
MNRVVLVALALVAVPLSALAAPSEGVPNAAASPRPVVPANPAIDMEAYLRVSAEAARYRERHRLTEDEFIRMSHLPGTVILDARSREKYDELHVKGAVSLSFPDIAIESLARLLPDKSTRILIYCNNNFTGNESAFASKIPRASLNLSTYIALYSYGYRNVWELGPRIDVADTRLEFESSR